MSAPKKGSNRVKGNLKPSSSSQAALLLSGQNSQGFIGFGGQTNPSYVPLSSMLDDVDSSLDADVRLVLRKLSKKDTTTKIKALQELSDLCQHKDAEVLKSMLPFWPRLYNRLSMDTDHKVREAVHNTFLVITVKVGKELAPYLKSIMGCWILSQCDTYPTVAFSAIKVFQNTFPGHKQNTALTAYRKEIFDYLADNLVNQTPQSLNDPKITSQEEMESKYTRTIASSLAGFRKLLSSVSSEKLSTLESSISELFQNGKFWKHSKSTAPGIKGGFYSFMAIICQRYPEIANSNVSKITPIVLHNLDITSPVIVGHMWEAILSLVNHVSECWNHVSWQKAFWPKLRKNLESGFYGNASDVSLNLLPLISKIPESVAGKREKFLIDVLCALRKGFKEESILNSSSDCGAFVRTFVECCQYAIVQAVNDSNQELAENIVDQYLLEITTSSVTEEKPYLASSPLFACIGAVMETFEKSEKLSHLSEKFGMHLEEFVCQELLNGNQAKSPRLLMLIKGFVTKQSLAKKTVKFDSEDNSKPEEEPKETLSQNTLNFYTSILSRIYQKIEKNNDVNNCFGIFSELFMLYSNKAMISKILGKDSKGLENIYICFFDEFIIPSMQSITDNFDKSSCLISMAFKCIKDSDYVQETSAMLNKLIENCCGLVQLCLVFEYLIELEENGGLETFDLDKSVVSRQIDELVKSTCVMSSNSLQKEIVALVRKGWNVISSILSICKQDSVFDSHCAESILFTIGQELIIHLKNMSPKTALNQSIQFVTTAVCSFFDNLKVMLFQAATEELMISLFSIVFDKKVTLDEESMNSCEAAWTKGLKALLEFGNGNVHNGAFISTACDILKMTTLSEDTSYELFERVLMNLEIMFQMLLENLQDEELIEDIFESLFKKLYIDRDYSSQLGYLLSLIYVHQDVVTITDSFSTEYSNSFPPLPVVVHQTRFNLALMHQMFQVNSSSVIKKQGPNELKDFEKTCLLSIFKGLSISSKILNFKSRKDAKAFVCCIDDLKSDASKIFENLSERDILSILDEAKANSMKHGEFDALFLSNVYELIVPKYCTFDERELLEAGDEPSHGTFHTLEVLLPYFSVEGLKSLVVTQVTIFMRSLKTTDPWLSPKSLSLALKSLRKLNDYPEEKLIREKLCRDILQQILQWRESDDTLFITPDDNCTDRVKVVSNIEIMKFLKFILKTAVSLLSHKDWDFILCALVTWIQKVVSYESFEEVQVYNIVFIVTACHLLTQVSECMMQFTRNEPKPDSLPEKLITEWNDFFSDNLFGDLLPMYITLCGQLSDQGDVFKKIIVDAMGETLSVCGKEQILKHKLPASLSAEDDVTISQDVQTLLNHVCPHLINKNTNIQTTAYNIIEKVMNEESLFTNKPDEDPSSFAEEACTKSPPKAIIDVIKKCGDALDILLADLSVGDYYTVETDTDEYQYTYGYLITWKLILYLFKTANPQFRAMYASYLRNSKLFSSLLRYLFILLPSDRAASTADLAVSASRHMTNEEHEIQPLAFELYYQCLETTPALVRQWWMDLDRKTSLHVEKFTVKFISPLLCAEEISSVHPSSDDLEGMTIKPRPATREVVATYIMAEVKIVVTITLPDNFPLGVIAVSSDKRVGATQAQWDRWLLQLNIFLQHQNGTIIEGLKLWKKNIDKRFHGVEDCMICFSVLHGTTFQLPKLQCRTCKKKYHSACLYKWFSTSMNSTCPLCRNLF